MRSVKRQRLPRRFYQQRVGSSSHVQVTEDQVARAVGQGVPKEGKKEGRQTAVFPRRGSQRELAAQKKTPVLQGFAAGCEVVQSGRVEDRGLEPYTSSCRNTGGCRAGGAESGANETGLVSVIDA